MPGLATHTQQLIIVEQVRGELHNRLVGSVIFAQDDLAREISRIAFVEALQQRDVKLLLLGEGREYFRTQLLTRKKN